MLLVRSMTRTTSTGLDGAVPHGPLHADETTSPVEPWLTPTTRPKLNGVLAAPAIRTALQRSPTAGLQEENRVGPEPAKSDATRRIVAQREVRVAHERHVARDVRLGRGRGVDPDQALVADRVRGARQARVVGRDRRRDESVDLGVLRPGRSRRPAAACHRPGRPSRALLTSVWRLFRSSPISMTSDVNARMTTSTSAKRTTICPRSRSLFPRKCSIRVLCRVMCGALRARSLEDHLDRGAHRDR